MDLADMDLIIRHVPGRRRSWRWSSGSIASALILSVYKDSDVLKDGDIVMS